jgi:hypothetical protein
MRSRRIAPLVVAGLAMLAACGDDGAQPPGAAGLAASSSETDDEGSVDVDAQLAAMQAMFPIAVDSSVEDFDVIGGYTMSLQQAYCDGMPDCDKPDPDVHADIIQGSNGLELQIPNVLTAGLFSISGSLFAVTDSDQIAEPCDSNPRNSRVSVTIFVDSVSIAADGTETLDGLGASLLVEVNETDSCGEGVIFYAAHLTPD